MQNVEMSAANVAMVKGAYDAFFRGDMDGLLAMCSPEVEWETIGQAEGFPLFGLRQGRDGVRGFFESLMNTLTFTEFEPQRFVASGDDVVALGHYAFSVQRTGRTVECDWAHVFTVCDGKITRFREHTDTARFVEAYRQ